MATLSDSPLGINWLYLLHPLKAYKKITFLTDGNLYNSFLLPNQCKYRDKKIQRDFSPRKLVNCNCPEPALSDTLRHS